MGRTKKIGVVALEMKFSNFYEEFVDKFDTPINSKLTKISSLKFMFEKSYLTQYMMDSNK